MKKVELMKIWLIGFIVFALIRYSLPNFLLGKAIDLKTLIVVSSCYGLALIVRKQMMEMF